MASLAAILVFFFYFFPAPLSLVDSIYVSSLLRPAAADGQVEHALSSFSIATLPAGAAGIARIRSERACIVISFFLADPHFHLLSLSFLFPRSAPSRRSQHDN